jgi:hypothetical protein
MSVKKQPTPFVERVADMAIQLRSRHLANYGVTCNGHDFTQRQLKACLILRAYTETLLAECWRSSGSAPVCNASRIWNANYSVTLRCTSSLRAANCW